MIASKATVARHTVTFEGVDAPSQRAPAPRFGDSTGARPSSSSSLAEKQTVARDNHVEGAFRGARVAPRLLGGWNGARREENPGVESPRPKSRAEPRSPVTAARRKVVAAEVKNLANQTAKATEEISAQISAIQASTTDAVQEIQNVSSSIEEVNNYTTTISSAVQQQGSATSEISQNVTEAAGGTRNVSEAVASLNDDVVENSRSVEQMREATLEMKQQAEQLRKSVESFLAEVAAA